MLPPENEAIFQANASLREGICPCAPLHDQPKLSQGLPAQQFFQLSSAM